MSFHEVPIGAAFDVFNGATPASGEPSYWDGDIPWITPADLGKLNTRFIEKGGRSITRKGYMNCGTQLIPSGSIILSTRAPIGHIAIARRPLCFNQGCRGLVPRPRTYAKFAYWALVARKPQLEAAGQGTTFVELSRDKLRTIRVPLPDLSTQKAIADFLDRETARIDQLIEKKTRQIELVEERFFSIIHSVVTGSLGRPQPRKASGVPWFGDVPSHWAVKPLRHVVLFKRGYDLPADDRLPGNVPLVGSGGVSASHNFAVAQGPGIVTGRYGTIGEFYFVEDAYWPLNTTLYSTIIYEYPRYAWYLLQDLSHVFTLHSSKSAVPGVDRNDIHSEHVPVPPLDEQMKAAEYLDNELSYKERIGTAVWKSIDRLREFRSALITATVTGQIDVTTWGRRGETDRRLERIEEEMAS